MNENKDMMTTTMPDGRKEVVEVLLSFKFNDNNNEYVIYTKNEVDESGNVTIYISNVTKENGNIILNTVADDSEWNRIKDVLRGLSKID